MGSSESLRQDRMILLSALATLAFGFRLTSLANCTQEPPRRWGCLRDLCHFSFRPLPNLISRLAPRSNPTSSAPALCPGQNGSRLLPSIPHWLQPQQVAVKELMQCPRRSQTHVLILRYWCVPSARPDCAAATLTWPVFLASIGYTLADCHCHCIAPETNRCAADTN